jgi:hypothetical protein
MNILPGLLATGAPQPINQGPNNALPPLKELVVPVKTLHLDLPGLSGFDKEILKAATTGQAFTKTLVDPETPEYEHILQHASSDTHPINYTSIERVVNPTLLRRFANARKERIMRKSSDVVLLKGVTRFP